MTPSARLQPQNSALTRAGTLERLRPLFIPAAVIVLTVIFFWRFVLTDFVLGRGDTFAYFYPYWEVRNTALMEGRLPLWATELFMGVPLLANSQLGTFYPPNWLVAPLSAPDGVKLSILLHTVWALLGTYWLAARTLRLSPVPALLAAVAFVFGGYMATRVEQINQYQGLAWLPWLLLLLDLVGERPWRWVPALAIALALQFFTGHTQTVFISGVGMALYALVSPRRLQMFLGLAAAGAAAVLLALPQLIPTLELASVSNRSGGLNQNEATAFSWNPFLAARGLLPGYDLPIFAEYIVYPGVLGLGLLAAGLAAAPVLRREREQPLPRPLRWLEDRRAPWIVLLLVGILFAFGQYNPLYWQLTALPGFNLFRVPARWLVLAALGGALLMGYGAQMLPSLRTGQRWRVGLVTLLAVSGLAVLAFVLTSRNPEPVPATSPETITLVGWGTALLVWLLLLWRSPRSAAVPVLLLAAGLELWLAARALPLNQLIPPDLVSGQRFTVSQMRAYIDREEVPGRLLSITQLLFDPGDRAALEARFARLGMTPDEVRTALVAIKQQESLAVNLPLSWGIPTIDGFDGGVLPTEYYSAFASLLAPADALRTMDGRLREILAREACRGACIPDQRWLDLTHTRYLLTDKIYDLWNTDVAYDTQFTLTLAAGQPSVVEVSIPFQTTAVDVMVQGTQPPRLSVVTAEATETPAAVPHWDVSPELRVYRYALDAPLTPVQLQLEVDEPLTVQSLTLIDTRSDIFQQISLGDWQRILSSDIKLYENPQVLPRAFVVWDAFRVPDDIYGTEDALNIMRDPSFDPESSVVLSTHDLPDPVSRPPGQASVDVLSYEAEAVSLQVTSDSPGYLLLTDAYYPGWRAFVNGDPVPVIRANVMFRAVPIPAGDSEVVFRYQPAWLWVLTPVAVVWLVSTAALYIPLQNRRK